MILTAAKKQKLLDNIAKEIENDKIGKRNTIGKAVPGEGNPDAAIVFVGEAPGRKEALSGKPFVGPAGKILRQGLADIGLEAEDVFITSAYKYLPKQITPTLAQIEHGKKFLYQQLDVIGPEIIVLLGRVAVLSVLGRNVQMTKEHGTVIEQDNRKYFLMLHPAATLHQFRLRNDFIEDFRKLKRFLSKQTTKTKKFKS